MKKLLLLISILIFSCKKSDTLSGKIELSEKKHTSVTIKNGTANSINLFHWFLKEEVFGIPNSTEHGYIWTEPTELGSGQSLTYSASQLGFTLDGIGKVSLLDSNLNVIATN